MKQVSKNKKILLLIFVLFIIFGFLFALGIKADEPRLEVNWPPAPGGKELTVDSTIVDFVDYSYRWGILLGGLAAFFALIIAGFQYLTSVGDPMKMREARDRIRDAILGLVLLLSTFIILNTLNPELTTLTPPTTAVPGLGVGAWLPPNLSEPCTKVTFFNGASYSGDSLVFSPADFGDCENYGSGFLWWQWGGEILKSVKMQGACQANLYKEQGCHGEFTGLTGSHASLEWMGIEEIYSIKVIDIRPPGPPVVENDMVMMHPRAPDGSCNVFFRGQLVNMNKNAEVRGFAEYGKNHKHCEGIACLNIQIPKNPQDRLKIYQDGVLWGWPNKYNSSGEYLSTSTSYWWRMAAAGAGIGFAPVATFSLDVNCNLTDDWYE